MHYFIDGYNLLFRFVHDEKDLHSEREAFIHDLNQKVSLLKLNVSVVFDAAFHMGEGSRSHLDALEILFTAEGESADDFILEEIQNSSSSHQETVVTSDKNLARQVRLCSAHTENVTEFIQWLNRSYKNKLYPKKKKKDVAKPILPLKSEATKPILPKKGAPLETYTDYYEKLFEAELQELQQVEEATKASISSPAPKKRTPRKPRKKKDPFSEVVSHETDEATEMERWLKIFEQRIDKQN